MRTEEKMRNLELRIALLKKRKSEKKLQLAVEVAKPLLEPFKKYLKVKKSINGTK